MDTPLMKQYFEIKNKYKGMILFYRVGDFYETFGEDAKIVSKELNIVLTSRNRGENDIPMAGIPYHALYSYVGKLVSKGYKVALCEQVEDPKLAKGIVKREVVRIFTAGTVFEDELITSVTNYIVSIAIDKKIGIVLADISTGELKGTTIENSIESLISEIYRINPKEIIVVNKDIDEIEKFAKEKNIPKSIVYSEFDIAENDIKRHFNIIDLKSFGIENKREIVLALGALIDYLKSVEKDSLKVLKDFKIYGKNDFLILDDTTLKNLEVFSDIRGNERNSLFGILDSCSTKMGSRELKRSLTFPYMDIEKIKDRENAIERIMGDAITRLNIIGILKKMPDIERIWSRVLMEKASPQDLISLKNALKLIPEIKEMMNFDSNLIKKLKEKMNFDNEIINIIENGIDENYEESSKLIKKGFDNVLDVYRRTLDESEKFIMDLERKESIRTGIKNLRIGYNDVFGYYIEIPKSQATKVPQHFIRKQTLKNVERFTTRDLQEFEYRIMEAKENFSQREKEIFQNIIKNVIERGNGIRDLITSIGELDLLTNLAEIAVKRNYTRPIVDDSLVIEIKDGRHPVLDVLMEDFIPNDTQMNENSRFIILTGPNMAGKSTYMRQIALIIIMAQMGSFVPASHARIGIVDRIYTRVGASDDILRGQSTFMNEMVELANIINTASERSFIILDEVGRGTSTFDGMSIAWAAAEYINEKIRARTIFATHYHQLIELEKHYSGIKNYHMPVKETDHGLIFTRKVLPGGMGESYGIEVASMAGLPDSLIKRAKEILEKIEKENVLEIRKNRIRQATLMDSIIYEEIKNIEPDKMEREDLVNLIKNLKRMFQG